MFEDGLGVFIDQVKEVMNAEIQSGYSGRFIGSMRRCREVVRLRCGLHFSPSCIWTTRTFARRCLCSLRECG